MVMGKVCFFVLLLRVVVVFDVFVLFVLLFVLLVAFRKILQVRVLVSG